jgi:hypothetical protein
MTTRGGMSAMNLACDHSPDHRRPRRLALMRTVLLAAAWTLFVAAAGAAQQSSDITGTVTARRGEQVRVEIEPRPDVAPVAGDRVAFSTEIRGIPVGGGSGEVSDVEAGAVWVRVTSGAPGLGMNATIAATGTPSSAPGATPLPAAPEVSAGAATPEPAPVPAARPLPDPDGDGLQPRVFGDGIAEMLVPFGLPMTADETHSFAWHFTSPGELTDEWLVQVHHFKRAVGTIEELHREFADSDFRQFNGLRRRYEGRRIDGGMDCRVSSGEVTPFALWTAHCRQDGDDYRVFIVADPARLRDADAVVARIVASLRVGGHVTRYAVPPAPPTDALEPQTLGRHLSMLLPARVRMWSDPSPSFEWAYQSARARDVDLRWHVSVWDAPAHGDDVRREVERWMASTLEVATTADLRFRPREVSGASRCFVYSYDLFTVLRVWRAVCATGSRFVFVDLSLPEPRSADEGDAAVQRMVESLRRR